MFARLLLLSLPLALLFACTSQPRVVSSGWDKMQDQLKGAQETRNASRTEEHQRKPINMQAGFGYGISLASFEGFDRLNSARQRIAQNHLADCVLVENNGVVEIYTGHYSADESQTALKDLAQWQKIKTAAERPPFAYASLAPWPREKKDLSNDPLDAHAYSGYISLCVAMYDEEFKGNWQEEVKRVTRLLRKEGPDGQGGVEAFYSVDDHKKEALILVGLFTKHDDWVKRLQEGETFFIDVPGPAIEEVQRRFPFFLRNNQKLPVAGTPDAPAGFQPTNLVELN